MKIVEITEPRSDFVYIDPDGELALYKGMGQSSTDAPMEHEFWRNHTWWLPFFPDFLSRVGALGITHKIHNNILTEFPREKINVGDVFRTSKNFVYCISSFVGSGFNGREYNLVWNDGNITEYCLEEHLLPDQKIGIMGVTHEINWSL